MATYITRTLGAAAFAAVTVGGGLGLAVTDAAAQPTAISAPAPVPLKVQGADVHLVAQWNEAKSATGMYQAPEGFVIESATPVVTSEFRSSSSVSVSADRREARLSVSVRGKGEFWNKERGWFDGYLAIVLRPKA